METADTHYIARAARSSASIRSWAERCREDAREWAEAGDRYRDAAAYCSRANPDEAARTYCVAASMYEAAARDYWRAGAREDEAAALAMAKRCQRNQSANAKRAAAAAGVAA